MIRRVFVRSDYLLNRIVTAWMKWMAA